MKIFKGTYNQKGFSIIEALIAFAVWTIVGLALFKLWFATRTLTQVKEDYTQGEYVVLNSSTNFLFDKQFFSSATPTPPLGIFTEPQWIQKGIRMFSSFSQVSPSLDRQFSIVDVNDRYGQRTCHMFDFGQQISHPQLSYVYTNASSSELASIDSLLSISLTSTSQPTAVMVQDSTVYLATNSASSSDPDFWVIDISTPSVPKIIASLNTGPGLSALILVGTTIYAGNTGVTSALQAIDVYNPASPRLLWSYRLPGADSITHPLTQALAYWRGLIVLGTQKTPLPEVYVFDVKPSSTTTVQTPKLLATKEIGAGVNALYIDRGVLMIASPLDPELLFFDLRNFVTTTATGSSSLEELGKYDAPGANGNGKRLDMFGDDLALGRTVGGDELMGLSVIKNEEIIRSDSVLVTKTFTTVTTSVNFSKKIAHSVDALMHLGQYIVLLASDPQKEFQVWTINPAVHSVNDADIASTADVEEVRLFQTLDLPARGASFSCDEKQQLMVVAMQSTQYPLLLISF